MLKGISEYPRPSAVEARKFTFYIALYPWKGCLLHRSSRYVIICPMSRRSNNLSQTSVEKLTQDLEQGFGIPTDFYYQQDKYQTEIDNIWNKSWLFLCPMHKLKEIGSTVTGWAGKVPVVVVRGRDNKLRGFINMCRHRGYPVATEDKTCNVLVCKYHAWTYNLDGTLRGAPSEQNEPEFDKTTLSLLPVSVDTIGPLVFVNADPNAASLASIHPKLQPYLSSIGFPLDTEKVMAEYNLVKELPYEFKANWNSLFL